MKKTDDAHAVQNKKKNMKIKLRATVAAWHRNNGLFIICI